MIINGVTFYELQQPVLFVLGDQYNNQVTKVKIPFLPFYLSMLFFYNDENTTVF